MSNFFETHSALLLSMYEKAKVTRPDELFHFGKIFEKYYRRYFDVQTITTVPAELIFCLHMREASCDFSRCFHNGDHLPGPTTHVPKGRGPFKSWEESAIDSLNFTGLSKMGNWNLQKILFFAEGYNGFGYARRNLPSPYLWSMTDQYEKGKFDFDGSFNPYLVDKQPGVAALLKAIHVNASVGSVYAPLKSNVEEITAKENVDKPVDSVEKSEKGFGALLKGLLKWLTGFLKKTS